MERKDTIKKDKLKITFHNPNTKDNSEKLAFEFISKVASGVIKRRIIENSVPSENLDVDFMESDMPC